MPRQEDEDGETPLSRPLLLPFPSSVTNERAAL